MIGNAGKSLRFLSIKALPKPIQPIDQCITYDIQTMIIGKLPKLVRMNIDLNFDLVTLKRWKALNMLFGKKISYIYQLYKIKNTLGKKFRREILWEILLENLLVCESQYQIELGPSDKTMVDKYYAAKNMWNLLYE